MRRTDDSSPVGDQLSDFEVALGRADRRGCSHWAKAYRVVPPPYPNFTNSVATESGGSSAVTVPPCADTFSSCGTTRLGEWQTYSRRSNPHRAECAPWPPPRFLPPASSSHST